MTARQNEGAKFETKIKHFGFPEVPTRMSLPLMDHKKVEPLIPKPKPNT